MIDNVALLQGYAMEMGQIEAVNVWAAMDPSLYKNDPWIVVLYNPNAKEAFNTQRKRFNGGVDLKEDLRLRCNPLLFLTC